MTPSADASTTDTRGSAIEIGPRVEEYDIGGLKLRALVAEAPRPRGAVFALHGGNSGKEYFDSSIDPALSLMRLGPQVGITVIAPDRPGYGHSVDHGDRSVAERTDLLFATLEAALEGRSMGGGVLVLGHSLGCVSAMRMATDPRGRYLIGLEISGTGVEMQRSAIEALSAVGRGVGDRNGVRSRIWGPAELYPPGTREWIGARAAPASDGADIEGWADELPILARRVRMPVRYTVSEHEGWWTSGRQGLEAMAGLFTASTFVETNVAAGAGHNISLGYAARGYHLGVLAFAERCMARRRVGGGGVPPAMSKSGAPCSQIFLANQLLT